MFVHTSQCIASVNYLPQDSLREVDFHYNPSLEVDSEGVEVAYGSIVKSKGRALLMTAA